MMSEKTNRNESYYIKRNHNKTMTKDYESVNNISNNMATISTKSPYRVIGIALVVDKLGKGPRMVFRYPTNATLSSSSSFSDDDIDAKSRTGNIGSRKDALRNSKSSSLTTSSKESSVGGGGGSNNSLTQDGSKSGGMGLHYNSTTTTSTINTKNGINGTTATISDKSNPNTTGSTCMSTMDENLFFHLSPTQFAKLFRPKPALCGQPMTLSVGGTIFCCCSVLMDNNDNNETLTTSTLTTIGAVNEVNNEITTNTSTSTSTSTNNANDDEHLVLFSVIVALLPDKSSHTLAGWIEWSYTPSYINIPNFTYGGIDTNTHQEVVEGQEQQQQPQDDQQQLLELIDDSNKQERDAHTTTSSSTKITISFVAIRRVHISLGRLCRVLAREEQRCKYVSIQSTCFEQIRQSIHRRWKDNLSGKFTNDDEVTCIVNNNNIPSNTGTDSTNINPDSLSFNNNNNNYYNTLNLATAMSPSPSFASSDAPNDLNANKTHASQTKVSLPTSVEDNNVSQSDVKPVSIQPPTNKHHRSNTAPMMPSMIGMERSSDTVSAATTVPRHPNADSNTTTPSPTFVDRKQHHFNTNTQANTHSLPTMSSTLLPPLNESLLQEQEQEILETIMAASFSSPPTSESTDEMRQAATTDTCESTVKKNNQNYKSMHHGNLGRELIQVFHAMTENDYYYNTKNVTPSPAIMLYGRDGTIYINRHLPVSIDSVADHPRQHVQSAAATTTTITVRPYQTLIFPHVTPQELIESLSSPYSMYVTQRHQQGLLQFLQYVCPQKSLSDISIESQIPMHTVIDLSSYLVQNGICYVTTQLSTNIRCALSNIDKIRAVALSFAQQFGPYVNLFHFVSTCTDTTRTVADIMMSISTSVDPNIDSLRRSIDDTIDMISVEYQDYDDGSLESEGTSSIVNESTTNGTNKNISNSLNGTAASNPVTSTIRDEIILQMVIWLCSQGVLVPIQDYIVLAQMPSSTVVNVNDIKAKETTNTTSQAATTKIGSTDDDKLLLELIENDCVSGNVSLPACCWKIGIEPSQLSSWIHRMTSSSSSSSSSTTKSKDCRIRLISRVPSSGDDWGAY